MSSLPPETIGRIASGAPRTASLAGLSANPERVRSALQYLDPHDRSTWVKMAFAIKSEFGDNGFDIWDEWGSVHKRPAGEVKATWKSAKPGGKVGLGSLFYDAKLAGWNDDSKYDKPSAKVIEQRKAAAAARAAQYAAEEAAEQAAAAERAQRLWDAATPADAHPYLVRKGVQSHGLRVGNWEYVDASTGEVYEIPNCLLIPLSDRLGELCSLQGITPKEGGKYLLQGGAMRGNFHRIGGTPKKDKAGNNVYVLAEGYATAASVHEATGHHVLCCFNAGNMVTVARAVRAAVKDACVVIAADNDLWNRKPDGTPHNPGVEAATKVAKEVGGIVTFPPFTPEDADGVDEKGHPVGPKDFNDWHQRHGAGSVAEIIAAALAEPSMKMRLKAEAQGGGGVAGPGTATLVGANDEFAVDPKAPFDVAHQLIARNWVESGRHTIHRAGGSFFTWNGTHYTEVDDETIRATLYRELDKAHRFEDGAPFKPDSASISKVEDALRAAAQLPGGCSIDRWVQAHGMPAAQEVVSMQNGLLHLPTRTLLPHTPNFFCLNSLPFDYDADAPPPIEWLKFLGTIWPDDPASIALLKCWIGYLISSNTSFQKAMLLIGPPRSGKGTIAAVLKALLGGDANVAGPRLSAFANNFGMEPLIGKRAAIVGDARLGAKVDQGEVVAVLLSITGEDTLTVDRKNKAAWTGVLPARIMICSNELPKLMDASGALASRFLVLQMQQSFLGREDRGLLERLQAELPSILRWGLDGWDQLQREGRFPTPAASKDALGALDELTSPIRAFIVQRCDLEPGTSTPCDDLYKEWRAWCDQQGRDHPGTIQTLGRDLAAAAPGLKVSQPRNGDGPRRRVYEGIRLRQPDVGRMYTQSFVWDEGGLEFIRVANRDWPGDEPGTT